MSYLEIKVLPSCCFVWQFLMTVIMTVSCVYMYMYFQCSLAKKRNNITPSMSRDNKDKEKDDVT